MFERIKNFLSGIAFDTKAVISVILLGILFIIVFIVPGIYLLAKKHALNYKSDATIVNSVCQPSEVKENVYVCNLTVQYPANDRQYTGVNLNDEVDNTSIASPYTVGRTIPVYYDRNNPRAFIIKQYQIKTLGVTLLSVGFALITILLISYSLKYRKPTMVYTEPTLNQS